ncbi:ATP-binding protein [Solibacillus isronensis]|uniref:ATP-binding protein n=1 Tax=Solibacillus isronensis TaxID=412383 RepID=UPI0009A789BE|nr:ATP-binding protein [Solibacillus isronensis]
MKLKTLKLKNFRGYKDIDIDFTNELNLIIGRNDVGKSTLMDALEIFFNGESKSPLVKPEIIDCNIYSPEKYFEISCIFEIEKERPIYLDTTHSTTFADEFLLNKDGNLEIIKKWNCSNTSLTAKSLSVSLKANYPKISEEPFILLKKPELQKKLSSYKDRLLNYEDVNKNTNSIMRKALFNVLVTDETIFEEINIEIKKVEDATGEKDIWRKLKENLPLFFLFQSDRSNSDSDGEVQNPLKIATKKVLADLQEELDRIKEEVNKIVSTVGEQTIEKLKEFDSGIASKLKTNLNLKPWDSVFSFDLISDDDIPLNKRGSGVRRLILLSYFRAEAERISKENNKKEIIYAIEEPETAQHPDFQKMILESLSSIANDVQHQVILTTHTPEIAKMVDLDSIIFIHKETDFPQIEKDNERKIHKIARSLGILPTIQSKVAICVEGENDVNFIMNLNQCIPEFKAIIDLKKEEISIMPLSGGKLINWINNDYLKNSNVLEFHIYDSDEPKYVKKIDEMRELNDLRRFGVNTNFLEMENYIPPKLVADLFNLNLEELKESWMQIDVPKRLINICMTDIRDVNKREQIIKLRLNGELTKRITAKDLHDMGTYNEIESWFKSIASLYYTGKLKDIRQLEFNS